MRKKRGKALTLPNWEAALSRRYRRQAGWASWMRRPSVSALFKALSIPRKACSGPLPSFPAPRHTPNARALPSQRTAEHESVRTAQHFLIRKRRQTSDHVSVRRCSRHCYTVGSGKRNEGNETRSCKWKEE